jgi:serine/threonine protein kinase
MTIIGHGTYGCIYKPPIKCVAKTAKTRRINYANKIAKLLTKKSANTEYEEYSIISKIDPTNKYHLGKPVLCEADAVDLKKQTDAHPCKKYEEEKDKQEFRLLIMEYGGIELETYIKTPSEFKTRFWKKIRNLLDGAELFAKNGLTHRDIKMNNILLNPKSENLIYIDFGLSRTMTDLKKDILNGTKKTHFHWIYPFENGLIEDASKIVKMTDAQFDTYYKKLVKNLLLDTSSESSKHVSEIFALSDNRMAPLNQSKKESMIYDAIDSVRQMGDVDAIVDKMVKSIDTFSLGLTLNRILNAFYDANKISDMFYKEMHALFAQMTNFNMKERLIDFKIIKAQYEKALTKLKMSPSKKKTVKRMNNVGFTPLRIVEN